MSETRLGGSMFSMRAVLIVCAALGCGPSPGAPAALPVTPSLPAPAPAPGTDGVVLAPGSVIQDSVARYPAGTTFRIKAGRHRRQSIVPKTGDTFIGEPGAILDGENVTRYAFQPAGVPFPANVTLKGFTVTHYSPPPQMGAIRAGGHNMADGTSGWVLDSMDVVDNATAGVRLGHRMTIRNSRILRNGQIGITGIGDSVLIEGNEIAYANAAHGFDAQWEAGGTKFVLTRDLVVRNNFVHHNGGPGLWTDINNIRTLYEGNRVEDNAGPGICHEISYAAMIRDNVVRRNGTGPPNWWYSSGVLVAHSRDVEVVGNTVEDNPRGIGAIQQNRDQDEALYGPHILHNVRVHDNMVRVPAGGLAAGLTGDYARAQTLDGTNRFERNRYQVPPTATAIFDRWALMNEAQWMAAGEDTSGTILRQ